MTVPEAYVELALRLGRHVDGLVDSHYGDASVKKRVDAEPLREPATLAEDANHLITELDDGALDEQRRRWLRSQLVGLETVARKLAGEKVSYADEVERCYGVRPRRTPEEQLDAAHRALDDVLPPGGSLGDRYQAWREGDPIPTEQLEPLLEGISADLRARTAELVGLPDGESAVIELVSDEPWAAYNYYEGGLRSRIAVNADIPMAPNFITELMAHELYSGHQTEHSWKEQMLYRERGYAEAGILMIGTPESLIAEGIAGLAVELLLEDEDAFTAEHLAAKGIDYDASLAREVRRARRALDGVGGNVALMLYEDGASQEDALEYLRHWALRSDRSAQQALRFITDPMWRSYVTTYADGYRICCDWVDGDQARFKRLLTEQLTPADLALARTAGGKEIRMGRVERAAENEALFREVNERIIETTPEWAGEVTSAFCECSAADCFETIDVSRQEYEAVRAKGERFLLLQGHEDPAIERVVERTDRFLVVDKIGEAAEIARDLDPRDDSR